MNPLIPGVFSDLLLPGLTLDDIRKMRVVDKQYRDLNIGGIAITIIESDSRKPTAEVAELETGDYTKTIPTYFFLLLDYKEAST